MRSQIIIRKATVNDLDWIVTEVVAFSEFYGSKKRLAVDGEYVRNGLINLVNNHLVLVAQSREVLAGFIVGMVTPHIFNPTIRTLCEMFWWVTIPFRNSRAGYLLLKEFINYGKTVADWITMCSVSNSPIKDGTLERYGFRMIERSYLLEV